MTFLDMVNDVLLRLRQDTVSTLVGADDYTKLVMKAVNDANSVVEKAWDWTSLREDFTINTVAGTYKYPLTNYGTRAKIIQAWNSSGRELTTVFDRFAKIKRSSFGQGTPRSYYIEGIDSNGDAQVSFFPTPNAVDTISLYLVNRSPRLTTDSDEIKVPVEPVMLYSHAYLVRERGEDQGTSTQEFLGEAQRSLSDAIALDAANYPVDTIWWTP